MKLRFYLRGLGIGILVTTIIFCLLPGKKEAMSDEEIRVRALELGMVESSALTLADIQKEQKDSAKPESTDKEEAVEPVKVTEPDGSLETEETVADENAEDKEPDEMSHSEESSNRYEGAAEVVKLTIENGANSYMVSCQLEENHLVEDAGEFDDYLCDNGYSRNIRYGTHEIPVDATWEEIAEIISRKFHRTQENPLQ